MSPRKKTPELGGTRLAIVAGLLGVLAVGLGARLVMVQLVTPDAFVAWGDNQHVRQIELPANRGTVVDRNGVVLAVSVPQHTIFADPRLIVDPAATALALAPVVAVDVATLTERLGRSDSAFQYVSRQVDDSVAAQVEELDLDGIAMYEEPRRFNPAGEGFARSILGRTDTDNIGISGLEMQFDALLTGTPGSKVYERTKNGGVIPTGEFKLEPPVTGDSLVLTIDQVLQFEAERLLLDQLDATGSQGGTVIAMDNRTGEVLAMVNAARDEAGAAALASENRALTWTYEPGSIAKPLTFAGVFEHQVGNLGDARNVPYSTTYNVGSTDYEKKFTDDHFHETEWWTPVDILRESSNIGTIHWAEELGEDRLYDIFEDFGIGSDTAIDFPNESAGIFIPRDEWRSTSLPTIAIGQGVATTPMQMALAYATIANGGVEVPPRLIEGSTDEAGVFTAMPDAPTHRVISERTADMLTTAMVEVVNRGTGANAKIPGYETAGKTGTAWKPQPNGTYKDEAGNTHYVASFAGFLPAADPQLTILVVMDDPSGDRETGSKAAAPLFAELSRFAVQHLLVPPTEEASAIDQSHVRAATEDQVDAQADADEGQADSADESSDTTETGQDG